MANKAITQGKEQLILLPAQNQVIPLTADPPGSVQLVTGGHVAVISGYAIFEMNGQAEPDGLFLGPNEDDDNIGKWTVEVVVGPLWRDVRQVSAIVTPSGIVSLDSDEVDHSRWVVRSLVWDTVGRAGGERIQLVFKTEIQGASNGFVNFAYQLTATGWLARQPTVEEVSADFT